MDLPILSLFRYSISAVFAAISWTLQTPGGSNDDASSIRRCFVLAFLVIAAPPFIYISYVAGMVVVTLAMTEMPVQHDKIHELPKTGQDSSEAEQQTSASANVDAITSSVLGTLQVLNRDCGSVWSHWRGLGFCIAYYLLHEGLSFVACPFLRSNQLTKCVIYISVSLVLAGPHMLWTNCIIAQSPRGLSYRTALHWRHYRALLLPTLAYSAAQPIVVTLPLTATRCLWPVTERHFTSFLIRSIVSVSLGAVLATLILLVVLLCAMTLTRVEAALLSDVERTIVPVDRSVFVFDDNDWIGLALVTSAWRSIDSKAIVRVLRIYAKVIVMLLVLAVFIRSY